MKLYLKGDLEPSMNLLEELQDTKLTDDEAYKLRKILLILLVGELYGLHNLHQILQAQGIKSTKLYKIWQKFTYSKLIELINKLLIRYFLKAFVPLGKGSDSQQSRSCLTIVIDHSIFKQWLKNFPIGDKFAKFFSGQFNSTVYGFQLTLMGISIKDVFYPIYFDLSGKKDDAIELSCKLLDKVEKLLSSASKEFDFELPQLYLSVDNGFNDNRLIEKCEKLFIHFICVPKKPHIFYLGKKKFNANQYIEEVFLPKEAEYIASQQEQNQAIGKPQKEIEPFCLRVRAHYRARNKEVTLLFFRLNGSQKVSVIYTTHTEMKGKTLRRRWFQRTYIEHFFRLVKNTLKIQLSISSDAEGFLKKALLFFLKGISLQLYRKFCNRKRELKNCSLYKLQFHAKVLHLDRMLLQELIESV